MIGGNQPKKVNWVSSAGQNLVQCEKAKKNVFQWGFFCFFFDILHEVYSYKHEVVFIEIPE